VTLINLHKTPFPWFGGKADAADIVWSALGDVDHYVEPFAGSLAVLLRRPHECNRAYHSETVNDLDGLLVNAWRAIAYDPDGMADACSWPVSELDLMARHLALVAWRDSEAHKRLAADPDFFDVKMAGWWVWGQSCWIGSGWCSGRGPWIVGDDGKVVRRPKAGRVHAKLPHLGNDGRGCNRPQAREPGVASQLPHLVGNGQGCNHAGVREPGVGEQPEYHPMTMPELRRWIRFLSARLRHVRIINGDWTRAVTSGASKTITVRMGDGKCGVFLDPPYADTADRCGDVYSHDSLSVAHDVRQWCIEHGDDPDYRIVLAGFDVEHAALEALGWRCVEWFRGGFLKGGMGNTSGTAGGQQHRERLWLSPHCLGARKDAERQQSLFGVAL
jgi:DNA adenine methylase